MTVKDRIKTFCKAEKTTVSAFEASIGVANGYVNAISKSIGIDKVQTILEKFPNLNLEWLLVGKGNMYKEGTLQDTLPIAIHTEKPNEGIPLIPISAMAGAFQGELSVLEYECERYIVPSFKGADFLIPVTGDSMIPTFQSGDIVACRKVDMSKLFFQWNKSYVLDTNQGPIIKRVKPGSDNEHVLIVSDNQDYYPFELEYNDIYNIALVVGLIRLE
ncbi:helix-turn-helix transcriptional regulator [Prevotella sp. PINT]|jgi:Predicted transcriptional regulator|uniref:S24 family peptidase n=1 Tax=Palleniella intestinalis TaxID=2736291 RepID=UPI001557FA9E|nr:helix-turn-helix transcriptional regulator [Palleniella intestinalis]NPD82228.1 helix-turn-helix transcriptional regulator [Palleniella intestinalis]